MMHSMMKDAKKGALMALIKSMNKRRFGKEASLALPAEKEMKDEQEEDNPGLSLAADDEMDQKSVPHMDLEDDHDEDDKPEGDSLEDHIKSYMKRGHMGARPQKKISSLTVVMSGKPMKGSK